MSGKDGEVSPGSSRPHAPELVRPYPVSRIGAGARFTVDARPEECTALAGRMGIEAVLSLTCRYDLRRAPGDSVDAAGLLRARVRQVCVVSLEPFDADIVEDFTVRFVPDGSESEELDLESDDEVTYHGDTLELGEATSEQLALALDPFPRKPGAELPPEATFGESSPFSALLKLRSGH